MRTDWRALFKTQHAYTALPDPERYSDVYDAISEALRRGSGYVPSASETTTLGEWAKVTDPDSTLHQVTLYRMPVTQVRVASAIRYVIGMNQYAAWDSADGFTRLERAADDVNDVVLPDCETLLKRKSLIPTDEEMTDLARFVVVRSYAPQGEWSGPEMGIVRFFQVRPDRRPASALPVLLEAQQRIHEALSKLRAQRSWDGRPVKTKAYGKKIAQLDSLVESFSPS